jgi:HEAT repeat protein
VALGVLVAVVLLLCRGPIARAYCRFRLGAGSSCAAADAARYLGSIKDRRAVPKLIELLDRYGRTRARVNVAAAWALGNIGDPRAIAPLCRTVAPDRQPPKDPKFLDAAIEALGKLGGKEAEMAISQHVGHRNRSVRISVLIALAEIGSDSAKDTMIGMVEDPELDVRRNVGYLLAKLRDARAIQCLLKTAKAEKWERTDVARTLRLLPADKVWAAVLPVIEDPDAEADLRGSLLRALVDHEGQSVFDLTVKHLENPCAQMRIHATSELRQRCALAEKKDARAVPHFVLALSDSSPSVRTTAAAALGELAPESLTAVPALEKALQDSDAGTRLTAREALKKIRAAKQKGE